MFESAKVGDRVWSITNGWGTILYFGEKLNWFAVWFDKKPSRDGETQYYLDGRRSVDDIRPTLFWSEVSFNIPPKPKKKVKKTIDGWIGITEFNEFGYIPFLKSNEVNDLCIKATLTYETEE